MNFNKSFLLIGIIPSLLIVGTALISGTYATNVEKYPVVKDYYSNPATNDEHIEFGIRKSLPEKDRSNVTEFVSQKLYLVNTISNVMIYRGTSKYSENYLIDTSDFNILLWSDGHVTWQPNK